MNKPSNHRSHTLLVVHPFEVIIGQGDGRGSVHDVSSELFDHKQKMDEKYLSNYSALPGQ